MDADDYYRRNIHGSYFAGSRGDSIHGNEESELKCLSQRLSPLGGLTSVLLEDAL